MKASGIVGTALLLVLPLFAAAQENSPSVAGSREPPTASIFDLIERVAKKTGQRFVLDARVRGLVPLSGLDPSKIDYQTLLAVLRVNDYATFTQDGIVNVVPDSISRQLPMPTYTDLKFKALNDELVTVLLEARNVCTPMLVPLLRPLMPQSAHLAADPISNTMLMTDRAANVRRVGDLFERLDRAAPSGRKCPSDFSSR